VLFRSDGDGPIVAVGGGYGAAALFPLADRLRHDGRPVHALFGAAREARVFAPDEAKRAFDTLTITTEDGSLGSKGLVTDALAQVVGTTGAQRVAACGPMAMLAAVAAACRDLGVPCEVAVEEFMACGIGVCWTCVIATNDDGTAGYRRSCTDGPVFDAGAVAWG